jgi:hypothetical protein
VSEIKPALAPEQFKNGYQNGALSVEPWTDNSGRLSIYILDAIPDPDGEGATSDAPVEVSAADRHALAALALYQQTFGFTREDVEALRKIVRENEPRDIADSLRSLADRVEALLPPEPPRERGVAVTDLPIDMLR